MPAICKVVTKALLECIALKSKICIYTRYQDNFTN